MAILFSVTLLLIVLSALGLRFFLNMRKLDSARIPDAALLNADRFRPMLRLLSDEDLRLLEGNKRLRSRLQAQHRELFRGYLRWLTRDYGRLLAGLRQVVVQSGADRPDLVRAIAKNRILFALTISRIELRLALHATGAAGVDVTRVVEAVEVLRTQVQILSAAPVAA
jgi:hypothetical protein